MESKAENITLTGVVADANVKLTYSRENENPIRQIAVHATRQSDESGVQMNVHIDYQLANNGVNFYVHNCGLENIPFDLIELLLAEMQAVING